MKEIRPVGNQALSRALEFGCVKNQKAICKVVDTAHKNQ